MGYYTDFTLKIEVKKQEIRETQAAQDLLAFLRRAGFDTDEYTVGRMITENIQHFDLGEVDERDIIDRLKEISDYESWYDHDDEWKLSEVKWYDHKDHMKQLSKEYPDVTFILSGDGEEQGDVWREVWVNGSVKRQKAQLVFEDE